MAQPSPLVIQLLFLSGAFIMCMGTFLAVCRYSGGYLFPTPMQNPKLNLLIHHIEKISGNQVWANYLIEKKFQKMLAFVLEFSF